jgi:hypothetical protein
MEKEMKDCIHIKFKNVIEPNIWYCKIGGVQSSREKKGEKFCDSWDRDSRRCPFYKSESETIIPKEMLIIE